MFKKEKSEKEVKKSGLVEEIGSEKETTYCSKLIKEIIERPEFYELSAFGLKPLQEKKVDIHFYRPRLTDYVLRDI